MKFCIIGDLHCTQEKGSNSFLYSTIPDKPFSQNPLTSFLKIMDSNKEINSDVLICLGDLGDKANSNGIKAGWDAVNRINNKMNCNIKVGVAGNHDVDSRKIYSKIPHQFIKNFSLDFPTSDPVLNAKYWNDGYCIYESDDVEILLINTVRTHLGVTESSESIIDAITLEEIEETLSIGSEKIKICILHHHPIKHSNIKNWKDGDSLENGDQLIHILNKYNYDLVIHGHKHQPRVVEYGGLTIFAAGSFSSFENLLGTGFNTMFHVVEFVDKGKGKILSWEFNLIQGWAQALNLNFPPEIGFGGSIEINDLAKDINSYFLSKGSKPVIYSEVLKSFPVLDYLIPDKLIRLKGILNSDFNLYMEPDFPLKPNLITTK